MLEHLGHVKQVIALQAGAILLQVLRFQLVIGFLVQLNSRDLQQWIDIPAFRVGFLKITDGM
jgi:hypothetical protein